MEFFLRYEGPLPSGFGDSRIKEKDLIRRKLSPQLKDLWETHPGLLARIDEATSTEYAVKGSGFADENGGRDLPPRRFAHGLIRKWKFIPLVVKRRRWICELKIIFLRRHDPGDVVQGGDLDNRMKTFFDGLRMPYQESEILNEPENGEDNRCFCLLEDDALIASVSVQTARLYGPLGELARPSDVDILMHVSVKKLNRDLGFI